MERLLHTKRQLQAETDHEIQKILRKYKKKLIKELDFLVLVMKIATKLKIDKVLISLIK